MLVGTAAGAGAAVLLASAPVKALRATVQAKSYIDLQRLHAEWRARMAENSIYSWPQAGNSEATSAPDGG